MKNVADTAARRKGTLRKPIREWLMQAEYARRKGFSRQYVTQLIAQKKVEHNYVNGRLMVRDLYRRAKDNG